MINEKFIFENKLEVTMTDGTVEEYTGKTLTPLRELGSYVICEIEGLEEEPPIMISKKDLFKATKNEIFKV